uniref:(northern house mosquito) hypothetical protein n=1 Tax=Culex pipiens TaxID=7175 RepID=A0A8D8AAC2_CULPI
MYLAGCRYVPSSHFMPPYMKASTVNQIRTKIHRTTGCPRNAKSSPELHSCAVKSNVNRVTIHSSRITNVRATARNRCPWNLTKRVILRSSMAAGDRLNQTVGSVRMLRSDLLSAAKKVRPHQD